MKTKKNSFITTFLAVLLVPLVLPMMTHSTLAEYTPTTIEEKGVWTWIKTPIITILFPAGGKKPMFLWWYANDTSKIYVLKYKGLIEYLTFDVPFYVRRHEAWVERIRERLYEGFIEPREWALPLWLRERITNMHMFYAWHSPILPFSACDWNLTGPVTVIREDGVSYVSFNFTIARAPPGFEFAKDNVIIRCRFYNTSTTVTESGDGYTYKVKPGELKMDLVVKNWDWNIDRINSLLNVLREYGIDVPVRRAGLALWINLASIDLQKLGVAEDDMENDLGGVESQSTASHMIVKDKRMSIKENNVAAGRDEKPIAVRQRLYRYVKLHFATEDETLAGFFKFVASTKVTNSSGTFVEPVTASYIEAGAHMRLFICYPYFGNGTLEHDPSLGVETILPLVTPPLVIALVGAVSIIVSVILVAKWRRKIVNVFT